MVGDVNAPDAVIECDLGVLGGGNALENERNVEFLAQARDIGPRESRLEMIGRGPATGSSLVPLREIALPASVVVEVDCEAERDVAARHSARNVVLDPACIATHVELKNLGVIVAYSNGFKAGSTG
jgi:hypothetical protein